jgi:hypothetical protein
LRRTLPRPLAHLQPFDFPQHALFYFGSGILPHEVEQELLGGHERAGVLVQVAELQLQAPGGEPLPHGGGRHQADPGEGLGQGERLAHVDGAVLGLRVVHFRKRPPLH